MMNVGLVTSSASMPRPAAMPRARTVFPVPSSPHSASTSPARAACPRRSPSRSVCSDEWLTRSSVPISDHLAALVFAALTVEPDGKSDEGPEDPGPHREQPLARYRAERQRPGRARAGERGDERDEAERADPGTQPGHPLLTRRELRVATRLALGRAPLASH